ncbi:reprolysin-like metallopeptidase [Psychroflexus tropicus]|uniref:zinc-dependent metalloprotease n=1 Tax=Psychroflexus tropicus TaxID=197345 RepID=UPI000363DF19|nr:zinc-dependent metalloprotease family protein [Psychroflexus tropicus]
MKNYHFWSVIFLLVTNISLSQNRNAFWELVDKQQVNQDSLIFYKNVPQISSFYELDAERLQAFLRSVPSRDEGKSSNSILDFPMPNGDFQSFKIMEASVMTPELQDQFPSSRSYIGRGVEDASFILRFSFSKEKGLSSTLLSAGKTVFIEPYSSTSYISFINSEEDKNEGSFQCLTEPPSNKNNNLESDFPDLKNANDGQLRTYRLALACTVEYAQFHGGTLEGVIAAMNTTMTRVNAVYERDLGVTMVMVPNESIIFLGPNPSSDPFSNGNGGAMLGQNQEVCDDNIGFNNYDIGHVFSTGGGGVAYLNSPCTGIKAGGVTGQPAPVGDTFDIDYVAHEMGHQYGANHTQNNNCNRSAVSVEPGSASTIMGYAGICSPNVQSNSDDYFHGENIKEMWFNISQGNSSNCGELSQTANAAPVADAGPDYFIPKSTPFILKGNATDSNEDDFLTYTWEQNDRTPAPMPPQSSSTVGPAFRSLSPSTSPDRFMPSFSTVLSGSLASTWEVVPSIARSMSFVLTVRDNSILAGNTSSDEMVVTTVETVPFTVQTPPTWAPGSTQTVNWTVGDSNIAPINCEAVNIYFSEDGIDFSTELAINVPNSGSAEITLPNISATSDARLLIEAADHIFYTVSEPFNLDSTPDFSVTAINSEENICNLDGVVFDFNYATSNGFSESTSFTAVGPNNAQFEFTPSSLNADGSFSLLVSNLLSVVPDIYTLEVIATSASITKSIEVTLTIIDGACDSVGNMNFETSTTGVIINDGEIDILSNLDTGKPSGYSDFTDISADLVVDQNYELTINANSDGNYQIITYVWIDWNQNCSFDDPGEQYDLGRSVNLLNQPTANSPLDFTVPADAVLGNTLMRVTTKYTPSNQNDFPQSCENGHDAEVEDYTINVESTLSQSKFTFNDFSVFPNPSQGELTVQLKLYSSTGFKINIFDIGGKLLIQKNYESVGQFSQTLNLQHLSPGVYILEVGNGSSSITKKIILE